MVSALASLVATLALAAEEDMIIRVCSRLVIPLDDEDSKEDVNVIWALEIGEDNWHEPIIEYLEHEKLLSDIRNKTEIQ